jgi:hypothetical protein
MEYGCHSAARKHGYRTPKCGMLIPFMKPHLAYSSGFSDSLQIVHSALLETS